MKATYLLPQLPPDVDLQTVPILQALAKSNRALAELQGTARALPNPDILIDTLFLQEARASSEIENIVTTQDEIFRVDLFNNLGSIEAKEVARYRDAMRLGYDNLLENGFISENIIIKMFQLLKVRDDGYRTTSGTHLRNENTGENVYTPPQDTQEIIAQMRALEQFINNHDDDLDPLIKMAIIHHQFESIHPFPDGNGRIGRILNVLYLTYAGLLDTPILYLSRTINATKLDYYHLLQKVRDAEAWEEWIIYMLNAVTQTAQDTLIIVTKMRILMAQVKERMRTELPKIYSQDLINNLFRHPYTRIEYVKQDLKVHYNTAADRLKMLAERGFVEETKLGQSKYYINRPLVDLFLDISSEPPDQ